MLFVISTPIENRFAQRRRHECYASCFANCSSSHVVAPPCMPKQPKDASWNDLAAEKAKRDKKKKKAAASKEAGKSCVSSSTQYCQYVILVLFG